ALPIFERVLKVIAKRALNREHFAVVVSARGKATDELESLLDKAAKGKDFKTDLVRFAAYQKNDFSDVDIEEELQTIERILNGVSLTGDYSLKTKDEVLSYGELISAKVVTTLLNAQGLKAQLLDSRKLIKTDDTFSNAEVDQRISKENVLRYFHKLDTDTIAVVTGFIGSTGEGSTTTLGRNGSNYSAALLASFLDAGELGNYTHVDGIFTASPDWEKHARLIGLSSCAEASG